MEMMVHCPSCHARLNVSHKAAGHLVRCPKCRKPFKVPVDEGEIVEDTVACWLEISHEEEEARKHKSASADSETQEPAELDDLAPLPDHLDDVPDLMLDLEDSPIMKPLPDPPPAVKKKTTPEPKRNAPAPPAAVAKKPQPAPAREPAKPAVKTPPPKTPPRGSTPADRRGDVKIEGAIHLSVEEIGSGGVRFTFDAQLLRRAAFRASMPFVCAVCGADDAEQLLARPLIWPHFVTDHDSSAKQIAARNETPVKGCAAPHEVVGRMQHLEEMPPPFNEPMPFYMCTKCAATGWVDADTTSDGAEVTCRVTVPHAMAALGWLGRVNGVCGDDYLELEAHCAAGAGSDDAFNALDDRVRKRIEGWYARAGGERFMLYLKDGDFTKSDAGLAGVVLTSRRLVYCKYHKHGEVPFDKGGVRLLAVHRDSFDDLIWEHDGTRTKLVRLRPDDTDQLAAALKTAGCDVALERGG